MEILPLPRSIRNAFKADSHPTDNAHHVLDTRRVCKKTDEAGPNLPASRPIKTLGMHMCIYIYISYLCPYMCLYTYLHLYVYLYIYIFAFICIIIQILSSYKLIGKKGAAGLRPKAIKKMSEGIKSMNIQSVCVYSVYEWCVYICIYIIYL